MIVFGPEDALMLHHIAHDVLPDRLAYDSGYTDQDRKTVAKLQQMADQHETAVVLSGADLTDEHGTDAEARALFQQIVQAELDHWVPNASQRLLYRAGMVLGVPQPQPRREDCGPARSAHALVHDWVASRYLLRCATCLRLFPDN